MSKLSAWILCSSSRRRFGDYFVTSDTQTYLNEVREVS